MYFSPQFVCFYFCDLIMIMYKKDGLLGHVRHVSKSYFLLICKCYDCMDIVLKPLFILQKNTTVFVSWIRKTYIKTSSLHSICHFVFHQFRRKKNDHDMIYYYINQLKIYLDVNHYFDYFAATFWY